jgi:carotenoid cleavage dioxygenase-like enzyme
MDDVSKKSPIHLFPKSNNNNNQNIHFDDWISDAEHEVPYDETNVLLDIQGTIPQHLHGILIRNGAAQWTINNSQQQQMFSHIFDGLAKLSMYEIQTGGNNKNNQQTKIRFATRFIRSQWYQKIQQQQQQPHRRLPIAIGTGPILTKKNCNQNNTLGLFQIIEALFHSTFVFDNTPVNVWDMDPTQLLQHSLLKNNHPTKTIVALTDAPPRAVVTIPTLETKSTRSVIISSLFNVASIGGCFELLSTAHPLYSQQPQQETSSAMVATYNVGIQMEWNLRLRIGLIRETSDGQRTIVAQRNMDDGIPYVHSFGITAHHAVIVLQPLRLTWNVWQLLQKGFLRSMKEVDHTRIIVFDLQNGQCVLDRSMDEKIFFYHSISTCEKRSSTIDNHHNHTVSIRLCAYQNPEIITGEDQFMRLEKCQGSIENRNRISKGGTICDITCDLDQKSVTVRWMDSIRQGFELPTTRYSRHYGTSRKNHPRFVYAFGAYANGSSQYDDWGLFKFDTETESIAAYYQEPSTYVSEPIFVPTSEDRVDEDDGVILSQIYDGNRRETALLILDAKNMQVLAKAYTGQRSPMDFHGTWIPTDRQKDVCT